MRMIVAIAALAGLSGMLVSCGPEKPDTSKPELCIDNGGVQASQACNTTLCDYNLLKGLLFNCFGGPVDDNIVSGVATLRSATNTYTKTVILAPPYFKVSFTNVAVGQYNFSVTITDAAGWTATAQTGLDLTPL